MDYLGLIRHCRRQAAALPLMPATTAGLTVALSIMNYFLLEKPCIFFGRKLMASSTRAT
jgi:peptidoglycan/LPS O-acetylase OafA/YrhL